MKTKAAVLFGANQSMEIMEVDLHPPKTQEVLVEMKATSVCHSDLNGIREPGNATPVILGHEGAGIVREVGEGVNNVRVGDRVALSWIPYCGQCFYCQKKSFQLCETVIAPLFEGTLLDGTTRFSLKGEQIYHYSLLSTFSQHTVVPARSCVRLPEEMPLDKACLVGCGVATGWGAAVKAAKVEPGSSVAVIGLGGVGICAVQGAAFSGAERVIAIDRKLSNLGPAKKFGASDTLQAVDSKTVLEQIQRLTSGRGVDYAIDATGNVHAGRMAFELTRKGGTVVIAGAFESQEFVLPASGFHRLGKTVKGTFYGDVDPINGLRELVDLYLAGKLKLDELIREKTDLESINQSFRCFEDPNSCNLGRSVIVF